MAAVPDIEGLSECISRAIQEHLAKSNIDVTWPQLDSLNHPVLRIEAFLEEASNDHATRARSERIASVRLDGCYHRNFPHVMAHFNIHAANAGFDGNENTCPYTEPGR